MIVVPDVAELVEQGRGADHEERRPCPTTPWWSSEPKIPTSMSLELDLPEQDQDAVDDRRRATEGREDHDQQDRDAQQERPDGEQCAQDQADHDRDRRPVPKPKYSKKPTPSE